MATTDDDTQWTDPIVETDKYGQPTGAKFVRCVGCSLEVLAGHTDNVEAADHDDYCTADADLNVEVGDRVTVESEGQLGMTNRATFHIRRVMTGSDKYQTADGGMLRHSQIVSVEKYDDLSESERSVRAVSQ